MARRIFPQMPQKQDVSWLHGVCSFLDSSFIVQSWPGIFQIRKDRAAVKKVYLCLSLVVTLLQPLRHLVNLSVK